MRNGLWMNVGVWVYLLLVFYFSLNDRIAFGHGLGDLIYIFYLLAAVVLQGLFFVLIYFMQKRSRWPHAHWVAAACFGLLACWITYSFTWGRGAEFLWNGQVFR
ncbi:MAG TPA: hypothetical protein PKK69_01710 [Ferruginibacter sp.]|nr:hypothetical protein [Ferruginibacter sp.]